MMMLTPLWLMLVVAAPAAPAADAQTTTAREPIRSVGVDVVGLYYSLSVGDVVLPVEFEAPMFYRMRFFGRAHAGFATGAGAGLIGFGGQVGFRLYPFSAIPLKGFNIQLAGGVTLPASVSPAVFAFPRPYASIGFGYAARITDRIQLTPGIELTPFTGFPLGPPLALRCGVAFAY